MFSLENIIAIGILIFILLLVLCVFGFRKVYFKGFGVKFKAKK
jgi:uncharacterized integral membrane protein